MKEIKFRAWDKNNNKMISIARFDFADWSVYTHLFGKPTDGLNCEIMQFTGLHDKNGKEIYEGDIVHMLEVSNTGEREYITDIIWEDACFVMKSGKDDYDTFLGAWSGNPMTTYPMFEIEVIGNIYENPELLEVK